MNDESRPKAAPESFGGDETIIRHSPLDDLDLVHRAYIAGYDKGLAEGQRMAAEAMAAELLTRQSDIMAGRAVETARRRHGDAWASAIADAALGGAA